MTVENSEAGKNEPILATSSKEEIQAQSVEIITNFAKKVGLPEILEDGLISQEEAKKAEIRFREFAKEYLEKTGKPFDLHSILLMSGYIGKEKEVELMKALGITITFDQLKVEMTNGTILPIKEGIGELASENQPKKELKDKSKQLRGKLNADLSK